MKNLKFLVKKLNMASVALIACIASGVVYADTTNPWTDSLDDKIKTILCDAGALTWWECYGKNTVVDEKFRFGSRVVHYSHADGVVRLSDGKGEYLTINRSINQFRDGYLFNLALSSNRADKKYEVYFNDSLKGIDVIPEVNQTINQFLEVSSGQQQGPEYDACVDKFDTPAAWPFGAVTVRLACFVANSHVVEDD